MSILLLKANFKVEGRIQLEGALPHSRAEVTLDFRSLFRIMKDNQSFAACAASSPTRSSVSCSCPMSVPGICGLIFVTSIRTSFNATLNAWASTESSAASISRDCFRFTKAASCLLYTSDAADEEDSVDLGGRRIIKKKKQDKRIN
eukprot:TRINITY_DN14957_c0_g1_i6.p1 TRINITY_DN14957_c0_g1~~TRINITY_DN14957_c0_g1_i6.p1  ORF type:complete len:146 (+),score=14.21 TRINITY_DN14957_c0_g1_i6:122-559(+)